MKPEDAGVFGSTFAALCELFDKKPSLELSEIYWAVLKDKLAIDQFKQACAKCAARCKFMPKPAELLEAIGEGGAKDLTFRIAQAWEAVYGAMNRYDYTDSVDFGPLVNAIVRNMGGWEQLCDKSIPDLVWDRKKFEELYAAYVEKTSLGDSGKPLMGRFRTEPVQVPIGGVVPPRQIAPPRTEISDLIRGLADGKSAP
jgi:Domain of unknown function (DUF6475)